MDRDTPGVTCALRLGLPIRGTTVMKPAGDIILITGSNRHIDTAVMHRLRQRFDNVVGFGEKAPAPPPPECVRMIVDIASDASVQAGLHMLREHHGPIRFRVTDKRYR